MAFKMIDRTDC